MSRISFDNFKCHVCGETNEFRVLLSTNTFGGGPDLDLRPGEMQRSTMHLWVHKCPVCGYVSEDVSDETSVTREWLQSERYLNCEGIDFKSDLAKEFYQKYMINLEDNNKEGAMFALIHAAWDCDDHEDDENAKKCRELALTLVDEVTNNMDDSEEVDNINLMRADLMRRTGHFDELIEKYSSIRFDDEIMSQILAYQLEKAKEHDFNCYTVEDVIGPE